MIKKTLLQRFTEKYMPEPNTGCWIWTASTIKKGYGNIGVFPKIKAAHRVSYELFVGKIPKGLLVCHNCDNPWCVNPQHLFLGTDQDNVDDMKRKGRMRKASGSDSANAKLHPTDIPVIREAISKGFKIRHIANYFKVYDTAISSIRSGKTWKHIQK